jgi:general secretion pathway protein D
MATKKTAVEVENSLWRDRTQMSKLKNRYDGIHLGKTTMLIAVVFLLVSVFCSLTSAEQSSHYNATHYKFISLSHIPARQGRKYLADLKIGTVSQIRGTNVLLVTATADELNKAIAILKLVDADEQFVIKTVFSASKAQNLPTNERLEAIRQYCQRSIEGTGLPGGISIGSFSNPPTDVATAQPAGSTELSPTSAKAIIDIHDNMVVLIAPVSRADALVSAIKSVAGSYSSREYSDPLLNTPAASDEYSEARSITRQVDSLLASVEADSLSISAVSDLIEDGQASESRLYEKLDDQTNQEPTSTAADNARASSYELPPIPNGEEVLSETLPEKLDIVYLLGLAGAYLNLDFVYDPAKVRGDVTLMLQGKLRGTIKVKDLYPLLETVLKFKGFVMTRHKGNLVTVVPIEEALDIDPALLGVEDGTIEHGDLVVTRSFKLEHIDTASAGNLLNNMKLGVDISEIPETKTLIVTEFTYRMPRVEALLELVDKPGEPRKFRFRQLQYTMAASLAPKLQTLAEQLGTVSITIAEETTTQAPQVTRRPGESEASYQRRVAAAQRAAQIRAQRAATQKRTQPAATAEPTVFLDADERTNRILMIGVQEQLDTVQELIDALDVEQQDLRTLGIYKIKHVGAEEVRTKLQELGIVGAKPETATLRLTSPTTAAKPPVSQPKPTTTEIGNGSESLLEEPQVVVVEPTNSLLVNATAEQHVRIATIINYVDSQTELAEMPYQLYPLENQSPEHLAEVLQSLIQETIQSQDKEGKIETIVKREEEIVIVPDPNTFSLIVYASKKNQEWIANLIEKLDKRRPQVLIDVTLVEVSRTDEFDLDLQLASKFPKLMPGGQMESNAISSIVSPFLEERTAEAFSHPRAGTSRGFYSDAHIQALLTAIESKSYGRILAKPKILVNDGQPGEIRTTDITNVKIDTVIIPEEGSQRTATDFREIEAGIRLTITPNISEGDLLRLKVELDRTDFLPRPDAELPPDTTSSNINTIVTVPDGRTIILGGLLKLNQTKGGTKVPIIGDIPLVGGLFRSTSNTDNESRLYVFVKANILRPEETAAGLPELENISKRNRVAFEKFEDEFQKYKDWPGIKPKPMDPLKVLEVE